TGVASSTYYDRTKASQRATAMEMSTVRRGRTVTEHSFTRLGNIVSDAQIEEWLMELVSGE
ncbi:IS3 family transposase, partial [Paenibacillus aceris]|nr:IS3 family transposase [Paenibacillus aceris]